MFNKRKIEPEVLIQQPLNYWEESSYMLVPVLDNNLTTDDIINRLSVIDNLSIIGIAQPSDSKPGRVVLKYYDEKYEINYFIEKFTFPSINYDIYSEFSENELNKLKECKYSIVLYMNFTQKFKFEYKLQLTVACNITDKLYGIIDESAEKLINPNYAKTIINSKYLPSNKILYSIQGIIDNDKIWLHTHGLLRCGITELEILESNKELYNCHCNIISSLSSYLIDIGKTDDNNYEIGILPNGLSIIVTFKIWTEALKQYDEMVLGGKEYRVEEHNTDRSIIFTYKNEQEMMNNIVSKMNILDKNLLVDTLFLITSSEEIRLKNISQERFSYVEKAYKDDKYDVEVCIKEKINENDSYEHMWFKLLEISDNNLKVELISTPCKVANLKKGDINTYKIEDISDWRIYSDDIVITPENVYLLDNI